MYPVYHTTSRKVAHMSESLPNPIQPPELRTQKAIQTALQALLKKPLSVHELTTTLQRHGYAGEVIEHVLKAVRAWGYLNDAHLAQAIRASALRRGKGPAWITQTLSQRGIDDSESTRAACVSENEALQQATLLLSKRMARAPLSSPKETQKALRFLAGRGFSRACAYQALREVLRAKGKDTLDDIF